MQEKYFVRTQSSSKSTFQFVALVCKLFKNLKISSSQPSAEHCRSSAFIQYKFHLTQIAWRRTNADQRGKSNGKMGRDKLHHWKHYRLGNFHHSLVGASQLLLGTFIHFRAYFSSNWKVKLQFGAPSVLCSLREH